MNRNLFKTPTKRGEGRPPLDPKVLNRPESLRLTKKTPLPAAVTQLQVDPSTPMDKFLPPSSPAATIIKEGKENGMDNDDLDHWTGTYFEDIKNLHTATLNRLDTTESTIVSLQGERKDVQDQLLEGIQAKFAAKIMLKSPAPDRKLKMRMPSSSSEYVHLQVGSPVYSPTVKSDTPPPVPPAATILASQRQEMNYVPVVPPVYTKDQLVFYTKNGERANAKVVQVTEYKPWRPFYDIVMTDAEGKTVEVNTEESNLSAVESPESIHEFYNVKLLVYISKKEDELVTAISDYNGEDFDRDSLLNTCTEIAGAFNTAPPGVDITRLDETQMQIATGYATHIGAGANALKDELDDV